MARIPEAELERLKREVSLVRLIEGQGHRLISQGKDLACRCPWHEGDDTPSCIVSPKTNLRHCFGCDAGGSVIDWIMRTHKVSFRHACELLAKQHPAHVRRCAERSTEDLEGQAPPIAVVLAGGWRSGIAGQPSSPEKNEEREIRQGTEQTKAEWIKSWLPFSYHQRHSFYG